MGTARVQVWVRVTIKTPPSQPTPIPNLCAAHPRVPLILSEARSGSQADKLKGWLNESRGQAKASTVLNTSDTAIMGNGHGIGAMLEMRDTVQLGALQTGRTH